MLKNDNIIFATDSYKLGHWNQYPEGTTGVYSYFESREGATYDETVFVGLQAILKRYLEGVVVTQEDVDEAAKLAEIHMGSPDLFNRAGWERIVRVHGGKLPVRIKAVKEGTVVPVGNVLMTVENTDPAAFWLTNALESLLVHVWHPATVATKSRSVKGFLRDRLVAAGSPTDGLGFMLHDFGYRGAAGHEAAAMGGLGHIVNFMGTDTLPAMLLAINEYGADPTSLAFSVPATEHSVMTALGRDGEMDVVSKLIDQVPNGILSVVADSFDIYEFVNQVGTTFRERILARDGVFVVRPDSTTLEHPNPSDLVVWILKALDAAFGSTKTPKGFKVLDPHVRVLWGDGIEEAGIRHIVDRAMVAGFSPENLVFGMGGGLLQKVNRDTQRFAFKSSAQQRGGEWHDVKKVTPSKNSKAGRLKLVKGMGGWATVREDAAMYERLKDEMVVVFENGALYNESTFDQIRERAALR
jgi:nicotinamide phosphoribosyltransferase